MSAAFDLRILASDKLFFEGKATSITVPAPDGAYTILPNHENAIISVVSGMMRYRRESGDVQETVVSSGFVEVFHNHVRLLIQTIERAEDIDVSRALRAKQKAEEKLKQERSRREHLHAEASLARALVRLQAASHRKH